MPAATYRRGAVRSREGCVADQRTYLELPFDEIDAGDRFRDGVLIGHIAMVSLRRCRGADGPTHLDLQADVHLAEESLRLVVGVEDELCRPKGVSVLRRRSRPERGVHSPTVPAPRYPTALAAFLASSYNRSRISCGSPGAGASSMIFW